ncbi:MAG: hypothetical protein HY461_01415 [Parcubacteria group bacterium]|nr:hypothetical protein [Parcubacteria group bacterium]
MRRFLLKKWIAAGLLAFALFAVGGGVALAQGFVPLPLGATLPNEAALDSLPPEAKDNAVFESTDANAKFKTPSSTAKGLFKGVTVACWSEGGCSICDGLTVLINIANGILRLLAIVAVVFFVYGAAMLVLSQGSEDMVSKGKGAMKATIIGTVIVLVAWQLMALVVLFIARNTISDGKPKAGEAAAVGGLPAILNWYNAADLCRPK